jgi:hypothetical protein
VSYGSPHGVHGGDALGLFDTALSPTPTRRRTTVKRPPYAMFMGGARPRWPPGCNYPNVLLSARVARYVRISGLERTYVRIILTVRTLPYARARWAALDAFYLKHKPAITYAPVLGSEPFHLHWKACKRDYPDHCSYRN